MVNFFDLAASDVSARDFTGTTPPPLNGLPLFTPILLLALVLPACSWLGPDEAFVSEPGGLLQTDHTRYDAQLLLDGRRRLYAGPPSKSNPVGLEPLPLDQQVSNTFELR